MRNDNNSGCGCFIRVVFIILALCIAAAGFWVTYLVATSDLPDWMKYAILK